MLTVSGCFSQTGRGPVLSGKTPTWRLLHCCFFGMIQGLVNIWALSGYKFDLTERYSELWKVYREAITLR